MSLADITEGALDHLVLYVGSRRLPFAEAREDSDSPGTFTWSSLPSSIDFSARDPVQLRLTARVFTGTLEEVDPVERKDGRLDYRFDLKLRERIWMHYKDMRDHAFDVTNGRVVKAKRMGRVGRQHIDGRARKVNKHWRLTVRPTDPDGDISISLPSQPCSEQGAVCTPDGKRLQEELELDISAVKQLSVSIADTTAEEDDEYLKFDVTPGLDDRAAERSREGLVGMWGTATATASTCTSNPPERSAGCSGSSSAAGPARWASAATSSCRCPKRGSRRWPTVNSPAPAGIRRPTEAGQGAFRRSPRRPRR